MFMRKGEISLNIRGKKKKIFKIFICLLHVYTLEISCWMSEKV